MSDLIFWVVVLFVVFFGFVVYMGVFKCVFDVLDVCVVGISVELDEVVCFCEEV